MTIIVRDGIKFNKYLKISVTFNNQVSFSKIQVIFIRNNI